MQPQAPTALPPRLGKYEILSKIGDGGMATVYRARLQARLESAGDRPAAAAVKQVALKAIRPELNQDRDFVLMFFEEVRLAMELGHRNIVQTFDAGREGVQHYFVMELVAGCSLRALLNATAAEGALLPVELALFVAMEVCAALDYAHTFRAERGGVIHRDVSPSNVLLSAHGEVKLADFGVAKAARGLSVSAAALVKGKLSYMAPEQARGMVEARSDLFALGAVLYESLCGQPVRRRATLDGVRAGAGKPPAPRELRPEVSPSLSELVLSCLSPSLDGRPATAGELRQRLGEEMFRLQVASVGSRDLHVALRQYLAARPELLPRAEAASGPGAAGGDPRAAALAQAVLEHALEVPTDHGEGPTAGGADAEGTVRLVGKAAAAPDEGESISLEPLVDEDLATLVEPAPSVQVEPASFSAEPASFSAEPGSISLVTLGEDDQTTAVPELGHAAPPADTRAARGHGWIWLAGVVLLLASAVIVSVAWPPAGDPAARAAAARDASIDGGAAPAGDAGIPPDAAVVSLRVAEGGPVEESSVAGEAGPAVGGRARRGRPRARSAAPGYLDINAVPWAKVYVDGRYKGETPVQRIELSAGLHRVRLVNPRYRLSRTLRLRIRPGKRVRRVIHLQ